MSVDKDDPNIGQLLINRYRLVGMAGQGSMGKVYVAEDELLGGVSVAVKFLAQTLLNDRMKERFASEAQTGAQLGQKSLHIVRVLDYGVHVNSVPFYVMEYMEGSNLSELIVDNPLPIDRFYNLMRHISEGLKFAHKGILRDGKAVSIVHRDIKPSNVFIIQDPSLGELAKVLDFGIAKFLTDQIDPTQSRSFMGTLAYCSPEQIEGRDLDGRSDIYSLGITMFEVLTCKMPIEPETHSIGSWYQAHRKASPKRLMHVNPDLKIPKALDDLVMACLEKSPDYRPQSMQEIIDCLEEIRTASTAPAAPASTIPAAPASATSPPQDQTPSQGDAVHSPPIHNPAQFSNTRVESQEPDIQQKFLSVEDAGWNASWPKNKPMAQIVFPEILSAKHQSAVGLWVMLNSTEIQRRLLSARYNHFLFMLEPHPMILWITTIFDSGIGPRWMPCYLDLKTKKGRESTFLLAETGYYPLIYFAIEHPDQPANVRTNAISPKQSKNFLTWLEQADQIPARGFASLSKEHLKKAYEKEKPKILQKLTASTPVKFID
jgi:eukaryotic-like serine/threonine-protein kinase